MEKLANTDQYVVRWEWAAWRTSALSPYRRLAFHLPVYLSLSPGICTCESRVMFPHRVGMTTHTELSLRSHLHKRVCAHAHAHRYINHAVSIGWQCRPPCFSVVSVIASETCFPFSFTSISVSSFPSSFHSTFSSPHNISLAREYMKLVPVRAIVRCQLVLSVKCHQITVHIQGWQMN